MRPASDNDVIGRRSDEADITAPMRALEFGANGIMVPHCLSAAEAKQWVDWTRFPPLGRRGFDGAGSDADYGAVEPVPSAQPLDLHLARHPHHHHAVRDALEAALEEQRHIVDDHRGSALAPQRRLLCLLNTHNTQGTTNLHSERQG